MKKDRPNQSEIDEKTKKYQVNPKNWFMKHKIITVILILFVIGIFSSSNNKDTKEAFEKGKQAGEKQISNPTPTIEITPTSISTKTVTKVVSPTTIPTKAVVEAPKTDREKILEILKANALKEWGDDYNMVKYELNKQTVAYDWVMKQTENLDIMAKAKKEWGDDYNMVKYEYEKQVAAYNSL